MSLSAKSLKAFIGRPPVILLARVVLAAVFIWAAIAKIPRPIELANAIIGYQIAPAILIAPAALILPFVELWAALAVLFGSRRFRKAGALILLILLAAFMAAVIQGLARGLDFDCGCFGAQDQRKPGALFLLQDGALALAAAIILFLDRERLKPPPAIP